MIPAMNYGHARGMSAEKISLLHRGVAAADDGHMLALKEEAITSGTRRNPNSTEAFRRRRFPRYAEPFGRGAGGNDQRLCPDDLLLGYNPERTRAEIDFFYPAR
jgi:hypothetical protein